MKILRVFDSLKIVRTMFVAVVAIFAFAPAHAATLPAGYTELEYIEGTGTQWIDTGIKITSNDIIETEFKNGSSTDHGALYGVFAAGSSSAFYANDTYYGYNVVNGKVDTNVSVDTNWHNVIHNFVDGTLKLDNTTVEFAPFSFTNSVNSHLFTRYYNGTYGYYFSGYVKKHKITRNGVVIINLIPARRDSDGVVGMYDLADSNPATAFHTNAGTGNFIAGEYQIKIATTKYNEAEFAPVQTNLETARTTINNLITQMQTNAINVSKLAVEKQTRPNATCPAGKNCLLVTDPTGAENWYVIAGAGDVETALTTPDYFSFTTTTLNAGDSISFSLTPSGTFTIDWGDGSEPQVVNRPTVTYLYDSASQYSHEYTTGGEKTVKITGRATGYSTDDWVGVLSFENTSQIASIDGSLGAIFPTLGNASGQQPRFASTFYGAPITSIPENLFSGVNGAAEGMFANTFAETPITSIPENLFRGVTGAADGMFSGTFYKTPITSIPENLFRGITGAAEGMFSATFFGTQITSIPAGLFSGVTSAARSMFALTFTSCPNLTGYIPESTFAGLIQNDSPDASYFMNSMFSNSTGLATACPQNMTEVQTPYKSKYWSTRNGNYAVMCRPN